jgi:cytochrome c6
MKLIINLLFVCISSLVYFSCKLEKKEDNSIKLDGKAIYMDRCTSCHGSNGQLGFGGAKDITISVKTIEEIVNQVANGKGAMAPYKNILSVEEIRAVSEYAFSMQKK